MVDEGGGWAQTRAWVGQQLTAGERIDGVDLLRGGWTSEMRRLRIGGPDGRRELVLRSFVKPFFRRHAEGLLTREAATLRLLSDTGTAVPEMVAVDATGEHCDHPSLLMSMLPGAVRLGDADVGNRIPLLAGQLVAIHRVAVTDATRPRDYQAWTSPERVRLPDHTDQPDLWHRAGAVIRREPPAYRPCFLHRDFHPGNVLFRGTGADLHISGVVDWVETSWGPADLDVAHCSTALALLHGPDVGMSFAPAYTAAGGHLSDHQLYWCLLDALAYAPNAEQAGPWRDVGRTDLTTDVLTRRLEQYLRLLFDRYG